MNFVKRKFGAITVASAVVLGLTTVPVALGLAATGSPDADAQAANPAPGNPAPGSSSYNGLALTPPMGWNTWYALKCNVNAQILEQTAQDMVSDGLKSDGYEYVNQDDCWTAATRDANGNLQSNQTTFPNAANGTPGMEVVADYVHSLGLKFGIYLDAGTATCGGYLGSYGHEAQDAATVASWGVDLVKEDQCNIPFQDFPSTYTHEQIDQMLYTEMSHDLQLTGSSILFSMCNGTDPEALPWLWGAPVSNMWRSTGDLADSFSGMMSNFLGNVLLYKYAGPGHWNDPDILQIGDGGMTSTEEQTEFSLWSEMAAPLIIGTNLNTISPAALAIYQNKGVIAVDQDALGQQGVPITPAGVPITTASEEPTNGLWILTKPLTNGARSVVLFNSTNEPATITTSARAAGLGPAASYTLSNLWTGQVNETAGTISAFVPAHGVAMFRVSQGAQSSAAPLTVLSMTSTSTTVDTGGTAPVTVSFANYGRTPVSNLDIQLQPPTGWQVSQGSTSGGSGPKSSFDHLPPGQSVPGGGDLSIQYQVTAPASGPPISTAELDATAQYVVGGRTATPESDQAAIDVTLVSPVQAPYLTANATSAPALFGASGTDFAIQTNGTGVSPSSTTSRGTTPASDSYGAIYLAAGADTSAVAQTTVTSQPASSGFGGGGQAGLIMRDNMTAPSGSPEGIALYVTGSGQVRLAWNSAGGADVDTSSSTSPGVTPTYPIELQLARTGPNTYTGSYSYNGGSSWTEVGVPVTVATSAAAPNQDVGIFSASGNASTTAEAEFSNFAVSG